MAARNPADGKRFVLRSPDKEPEAYFVPVNGSRSSAPLKPSQPPPMTIRSADATTPRADVTKARRIVVVRHPNNPQVEQGPVDLGDFGKPNSVKFEPVLSDGYKSVYLIRRPIALPETPQSAPTSQPTEELERQPSPTTSLQHIRTPTPTEEILTTSDPPRSPSPRPKSSRRPTSSTHPVKSERYVPYLKHPRSKPRTPSPVHTSNTRRSSSPKRARPVHVKRKSLSPPPKVEQPREIVHKRGCCPCLPRKSTAKPVSSLPPVTIETEQGTVQNHETSPIKSARRKKSAGSRAKSVVFVNPDDQSIVIVEKTYIEGEPIRPVIKQPKSTRRTRFDDETNNEITETSVKRSRWQTCLGCLSRHMCLIIIICVILVLIGLAGVGVGAYFLALDTTTNLIPKIVGVAVGGVLAIAALCFLYIILACIGSRDGYFSYNDDGPHSGGRAFALIPPSHHNAQLYIPRDYMKMVENSYPPPATQALTGPVSNHGHSSPTTPVVSTIPYNQQHSIYRTNTSTNGREMSPRSRERSLNEVVRNIVHVVEDAKKRYNGDVPNKVIVKVDEHAMQTA